MNPTAILKAAGSHHHGAGIPRPAGGHRQDHRGAAAGTGLWVFIGVATTLFTLFIWAYVMRMDGTDWSPIPMPWQLWLSTALLMAGSVTLQGAGATASDGRWDRARILLLAGGGFALAFLGVQLWAWQALMASRVMPVGNPAGSFFFLLTALHGMHVAGGLVGWVVTASRIRDSDLDSKVSSDPARIAWRIRLCARYWHFLLAVWIVLFATLGWLTPEVVRLICGTN
jgi:cytochrome c oxidase subunit 3